MVVRIIGQNPPPKKTTTKSKWTGKTIPVIFVDRKKETQAETLVKAIRTSSAYGSSGIKKKTSDIVLQEAGVDISDEAQAVAVSREFGSQAVQEKAETEFIESKTPTTTTVTGRAGREALVESGEVITQSGMIVADYLGGIGDQDPKFVERRQFLGGVIGGGVGSIAGTFPLLVGAGAVAISPVEALVTDDFQASKRELGIIKTDVTTSVAGVGLFVNQLGSGELTLSSTETGTLVGSLGTVAVSGGKGVVSIAKRVKAGRRVRLLKGALAELDDVPLASTKPFDINIIEKPSGFQQAHIDLLAKGSKQLKKGGQIERQVIIGGRQAETLVSDLKKLERGLDGVVVKKVRVSGSKGGVEVLQEVSITAKPKRKLVQVGDDVIKIFAKEKQGKELFRLKGTARDLTKTISASQKRGGITTFFAGGEKIRFGSDVFGKGGRIFTEKGSPFRATGKARVKTLEKPLRLEGTPLKQVAVGELTTGVFDIAKKGKPLKFAKFKLGDTLKGDKSGSKFLAGKTTKVKGKGSETISLNIGAGISTALTGSTKSIKKQGADILTGLKVKGKVATQRGTGFGSITTAGASGSAQVLSGRSTIIRSSGKGVIPNLKFDIGSSFKTGQSSDKILSGGFKTKKGSRELLGRSSATSSDLGQLFDVKFDTNLVDTTKTRTVGRGVSAVPLFTFDVVPPSFDKPPPPPPSIPTFDFISGRKPRKRRAKRRKGKGKRGRVTPSFEAILFRRRGKKPKRKVFTGFEDRPIF
jgi:hypothetical protein